MIVPGGRTPSPGALPLAFLVTASGAFVLAALFLPWLAPELAGHYYHPRVLAVTHTVTLGWITLAVMGASHQLIPVLLERTIACPAARGGPTRRLRHRRIGVVGHFALAEWRGFVWSAALVAIAALVHVVHVGVIVVRARGSLTRSLMIVALVGLAATVLFGTLLAVTKLLPILPGALFPTLHAHVHLALLGFVVPMVFAVAARVYPCSALLLPRTSSPAREPRSPMASLCSGDGRR